MSPNLTRCYTNLFWKFFYGKECREDPNNKKCGEMEYGADTGLEVSYQLDPNVTDYYGISPDSFWFSYRFTAVLASRQGRRLLPYKLVEKEYLVFGPFRLFNNVGGALGLLLGFSLMGVIRYSQEIFRRCYHRNSRTICNS